MRPNRERKSGDEGDRTPNPRLAKPVLSQLSYVPESEDRPIYDLRLVCQSLLACRPDPKEKKSPVGTMADGASPLDAPKDALTSRLDRMPVASLG